MSKSFYSTLANLDAEKLVIGNLLNGQDAESFGLASELLSESSFTLQKHSIVFAAMRAVFDAGNPINYGTVALELQRRNKLASIGSLVEMTDGIPGLANLGTFCEAVAESERLRKIWKTTEGIQQRIQQGERSEEIVQSAEADLMGSQTKRRGDKATRPSEIIKRAGGLDKFITPSSEGIIATPFLRLNKRTGGGLRRQQVWTIGGLSGSGKSSFACNLIEHAIFQENKRVKLISAEMGNEEVLHNLICTRAKVDSQAARAGFLSTDQRAAISEAMSDYAEVMDDFLEIEEQDASSVPAIAALMRKNISQGRPVDLLVVDFMQLLSGVGKFSGRREEVDQIAYGIKKGLAKPFNVPVLNLAQLNTRKLDTGQGSGFARDSEKPKKPLPPSLGDFRESGAIEQSSDICIILRRTDVEQQFHTTQLIDLFLLKQRGGRLGKIPFKFHAQFRQFEEVHSPGEYEEAA